MKNLNNLESQLSKLKKVQTELLGKLTKEEREQYNRFMKRAIPLVKSGDIAGLENLKNNSK